MKSTFRIGLFLLSLLMGLLWCAPAMARERDPWRPTLERVSRAVMSITVSAARALDTESASSSSGTGFIVDLERGIVLTNRHMVHVGPVRAKGITLDHEEVELYPIYRDPIHDFGFYRFDPSQVRYMELAELPLAPEAARLGMGIRVVGNDAGEKLSILDGTLARLDRPAPYYGKDGYNDFNTFYYQAATSTSGGSSGSPVVDVEGRVIALNAGGRTDAASSFYLPLLGAARALERLRKAEPISRGTIQAVYTYEPYNELNRLGLQQSTETLFRSTFPHGTGMLVVREVIAESPAEGQLHPGDILVRLDGTPIRDFESIESALDKKVGSKVLLDIERGETQLSVELPVSDLHTLMPSRYIEFSQAILQETSMQIALNSDVPARGVMVVDPGYALARATLGGGTILIAMDDQPIKNLDDAIAALSSFHHGQRVRVRYRTLANPKQEEVGAITIDRRWAPLGDCRRDDSAGRWNCVYVPESTQAPPAPKATAKDITFETTRDPVAAILTPSLCHVRYSIPYWTEGVAAWSFIGVGLVIDEKQGIVITDRGTVPVALGDAEITFASSVRVPAKVLYLHPVHNIAVIQYDPELVRGIPIKPATLLPESGLDAGDTVHQVGLTSSERVVAQVSTISRVDSTGGDRPDPPGFREYNSEGFQLVETAPSIGGVLADEKGRVRALWAFNPSDAGSGGFMGLPIELVNDVVAPFKAGKKPEIPDLGVEVQPIPLKAAADQGVPEEWLSRLSAADPERRRAIQVSRTVPRTQASEQLRGGDLILAIEGKPITRLRQIETLLPSTLAEVRVTRFREGKAEDVVIKPVMLEGTGVTRVLSFAGALFHEPHRQAGLQYNLDPGGLYVSWYWYGAPAALSDLKAAVLVRTVNDQPVNSIDELAAQIRRLGDRAPVRLGVESLRGMKDVVTLETDLFYWPSAIIGQDGDTWRWTLLKSSESAR